MVTIPNLMTIARIAFGPVVFVLILYGGRTAQGVALALFVLCGILDKLDGWLARRLDQISDFGIVWDPLADKVLIHGTMLAAAAMALVPMWFVYLCILRDLVVSGMRASSGLPPAALAADRWGKWKTRLQFAFMTVALARTAMPAGGAGYETMYWTLLSFTAVVTILSGARYVGRYA